MGSVNVRAIAFEVFHGVFLFSCVVTGVAGLHRRYIHRLRLLLRGCWSVPAGGGTLAECGCLSRVLSSERRFCSVRSLARGYGRGLVSTKFPRMSRHYVRGSVGCLRCSPFCTRVRHCEIGNRQYVECGGPSFAVFEGRLDRRRDGLVLRMLGAVKRFSNLTRFR